VMLTLESRDPDYLERATNTLTGALPENSIHLVE